MTQYTMTVKSSNTRLRKEHTTFSTPEITNFASGAVLVGDEIWIAPADGNEVKKNDTWLRVTHVDGKILPVYGWTAYIHKGVPICENFKEVTATTPPPAPQVVYVFPESFTLVAPDNSRAQYMKVV